MREGAGRSLPNKERQFTGHKAERVYLCACAGLGWGRGHFGVWFGFILFLFFFRRRNTKLGGPDFQTNQFFGGEGG